MINEEDSIQVVIHQSLIVDIKIIMNLIKDKVWLNYDSLEKRKPVKEIDDLMNNFCFPNDL